MVRERTRKLTTVAVLCAIAYIVMLVGRVPVVLFLKYDPKDVIITLGGFIFGPLAAFSISLVVSLVEMFTTSDTGIIGLVMNIISSCAFACTASAIYKYKRTMAGAVAGLVAGVAAMTAAMLLWNYLITPLYMDVARADVAAILTTVFLPFNLLKSGINATLTILIYKPVVNALRKSNLLPPSSAGAQKGKLNIGVMLVALLLLASLILFLLSYRGII